MTANPTSRHSTAEFRHNPAEGPVDPLSPAQQRLWFLAQIQGAGEAYHLPVAVELRGELDRLALSWALDTLIARHEVLRTRLVAVDGAPRREVDPRDTGFPLAVRDLTGQPDVEQQLALLQTEMAAAPFDLAVDPPIRGCLVALADDRHVLLLTLHHIASDNWSLGVLKRELSALYGAFITGQGDVSDPLHDSAALPEPAMQYADYAVEQRHWLAEGTDGGDDGNGDGAAAAQRTYWQRALAGAPELLELPTDRPRPAEQDYRGGQVPVHLDEELTAALEEFARRNHCSVFMAVLAGWALVLSRHSGQEDVVIGTTAANRERAERVGLIGFFANTLALRLDLSGRPTVADLITRVRGVAQSATEHAELPFEQVVDLVKPSRSLARTPLFQVMFAWQDADEAGSWTLPGVEVTDRQTGYVPAKFDLALSLGARRGCIEGTVDFAAALFDATTAARYARHLRQVLAEMVALPDRPATELSLLDEEERRQVLVDFNDTARPGTGTGVGVGVGLVERFEAQVRERPEQIAVVHRGEQLDYAALDLRADRLARALALRGVGIDRVVGLHTDLSVDMVVGILGVLKAGGAYLPLDPALPAERLAGMVTDAGAVLVLSNTTARQEGWLSLADLEAESAAVASAGPAATPLPGAAARPQDLAYVIYTSGSTGRPKGVAATHRGILNLLDHWLAEFGATPGLPSAMWPSFSFDASVQEFLLPLTTGGVLHLVPQDVRDDPEALTAWLAEHRVVDVLLPPAFVKWICEAPVERLRGLALRCVRTGLQPLPEDSLYRMEQALPGLRVLNGYGPTETALYCTAYLGPRPLARQAPIGRPVSHTRTYVLDERREPVPIGVTGELYIAGAGLARGYLNSPELTAERFVPDPFVPGERMYRSGDLVRWLPEGNLLYVGRGDHQIKLRGFRVELGEIEATLLDEPGVTEAAVLTDHDASGEPYLVAALATEGSPTGTAPRSAAQWRAALARRLPSHMIPAFFVELPLLPQTANGKLDRTAVLDLSRAARPAQVNQASPRDHIELTLYQIWQRLLLHPDIGIRDSFFDIGGTSISAIKLAHAVRAEFGQSLPIRDLLLHPTIEELGGRLRRGAGGAPPSNLLTFRAGDGHAQVVCVHPAGGTAFCYLSLAKALPDSLGIHGIQSPGVNPGETFLPTVEAMAQSYLELIEPLLASPGPLVLTGLSYGGLVAHEMGRRLAEAGRAGLSVVLLDTPGTDDPQARAEVVPADMAEFRDKLIKFNGMYPGIDDQQIEQYFHLYNHNRMTTVDHVAAPTTARTVLMQATEGATQDELRQVRDFWQRRTDGSCVVEAVACGHWDMLESAELPQVAARIEAELGLTAGPATGPGTTAGTSATSGTSATAGTADLA